MQNLTTEVPVTKRDIIEKGKNNCQLKWGKSKNKCRGLLERRLKRYGDAKKGALCRVESDVDGGTEVEDRKA